MHRRAAVLLIAALAGCAPGYVLVKVGPEPVGDRYSVDTPVAWSARSLEGRRVWTRNGPLLDWLEFFDGVAEGKPLYPVKDAPVFRSEMSPSEVMEFVVDSGMRVVGGVDVVTEDLRPAPFGGRPGFRFAFRYVNADGLEKRGLAAGAVVEGRLYLILFSAASEHYFAASREAVDAIMNSVAWR